MTTTIIDGISVDYDDAGAGPALVLVHGHPFDRSMWRPQVELFGERGWRVIAADLRGYGRSTVVPGRTPMATFARDIAGLLDHLGIESAVLCGLSMGGQIVMEFHRLFAHRVRGLVLADTSPHGETEDGKKARQAAADRLLREGMGPYADEVLPMMVDPANIDAFPEVAEHVLAMMRATPPVGAAAALLGRADRPDYVAMLAEISVPTLVVVGSADRFTPVDVARATHERVPGSTLAVIDGAGHMPNLERRAEFDAALSDLLDAVEASGQAG